MAAYVRDGMAEASATGHTEYIARWFRDYAEVRVAEEVGRVLDKEWGRRYLGLDTDKLAADVKARREAAAARLVPRHDD